MAEAGLPQGPKDAAAAEDLLKTQVILNSKEAAACDPALALAESSSATAADAKPGPGVNGVVAVAAALQPDAATAPVNAKNVTRTGRR